MNSRDAIEFFIAGASAVQIGTATFVQPDATVRVLEGIEKYLQQNKFAHIRELVGCLQTD